jgi:hypothetical protein
MDWLAYKRMCDRPDVLSRWMIEQTYDLLGDDGLRRSLAAVLNSAPLPKPEDHRGGGATDMFVLGLRLDDVVSVERAIVRAVSEGRTTAATRQRGLGGFAEAWTEYRRHLESAETTAAVAAVDSSGAGVLPIQSNFIGEVR